MSECVYLQSVCAEEQVCLICEKGEEIGLLEKEKLLLMLLGHIVLN